MKEYKHWIDGAKGIGMICVIYAHLYNVTGKALACIFCIPLFFFIAGYTYNVNSDFKTFLIKKLKRFGVAYILYGLLNGLVYEFVNENYGLIYIKNVFINLILQQRYLIMWFLTTLFILEIIMYFILKRVNIEKAYKKVVLFSLFIYILGRIYFRFYPDSKWIWNFDICFTVQFYFILGKIFRIKSYFEKSYTREHLIKITVIFLLMSILLGLINYKVIGSKFDIFANSYHLPVVSEIAILLGIIGTISFSQITNIKLIEYIGKHSMQYMMIHSIVIKLLQRWIFLKYINCLDNFIGAIITFIICIYGIKLIIELKDRFTNKIHFQEKKHEKTD